MTRAEFFDWAAAREGEYEFDGFEPVAMTRPRANHQRAVMNTAIALRSRLRPGCEGLLEPGVATIGDAVRYPDVGVTRTPPRGDTRVVEGIILVVEVLSHDSGRRDRVDKLREYYGHYVLVDPVRLGVTLFSRATDAAEWTARGFLAGEAPAFPEIDVALPVDEIFAGLDLAAA